jgi:hypothetical protein
VEFGGQTMVAIANGGQPLAAKCYDGQGIELILFFLKHGIVLNIFFEFATFLNFVCGSRGSPLGL